MTRDRTGERGGQADRRRGATAVVVLGVAVLVLGIAVLVLAVRLYSEREPAPVSRVADAPPPTTPPAPTPTLTPPAPEATTPRTRDEWLAELEARTVREPDRAPPTAAVPEEPSAPLTEEEQQVKLARSVYGPALRSSGPDIRRLGEIQSQYERACAGGTVVDAQTDPASVPSEGTVEGTGPIEGSPILFRGNQRTMLWLPPRTTSTETEDGDTPQCQALGAEAHQLVERIEEAREAADRVAVEKGVWTRIQTQVEREVLSALATPPRSSSARR